MKKALVILLAFALVFGLVFAACSNGTTGGGNRGGGDNTANTDNTDGDDGTPSGNADPIDVAFAQGMLDVWGGGEIKATDDGKGFTFTYGTGSDNSHGNAVAMFKVDLGEARVRDYEKVTFTFTGIEGDLGPDTGQYDKNTPKGVNLLAADDKDKMKNFGGNDAGLVTYIVNAYSGAASGAAINAAGAKIGTQPAAIDLELAIAPSRPQASNKGEVWFSFYLHASAVKYNGSSPTTEKTSFKITNVIFVPHAKALGDVAVDEKDITGVAKPVAGETPVAAITETAQYTGAVAWAGTLDGAGKFVAGTVYTATITLTAEEGFTFKGVAADFFEVAGATTTNPADSGVVTAVFPAAVAPATAVTVTVGSTAKQTISLTAPNGTVTPLDDGTGYTYVYDAAAGYRNGYAVFKVDLGGALSGFASVDFIYDTISGDGNYKPVFVYASTTTLSGNLESAANTDFLVGSKESGNPVGNGNANAVSIPIDDPGTLTGELFFAIAVPCGPTGSGNATSYKITNIKFVTTP
jgi:hypothetical protein